MFITFEGISGAGVSTQAKAVSDQLKAAGHDVVLTREPGGSPGAEKIRSLLLGEPERWSPETNMMLRATARRDHMERVIWPALEAKKIVICDRYVDFDRATPFPRSDTDVIHQLMISTEADLTFLIDTDFNLIHQRNFPEKGVYDFDMTTKKKYLALAIEFASRFRVIDGNKSQFDVLAEIITHLQMEDILPVFSD